MTRRPVSLPGGALDKECRDEDRPGSQTAGQQTAGPSHRPAMRVNWLHEQRVASHSSSDGRQVITMGENAKTIGAAVYAKPWADSSGVVVVFARQVGPVADPLALMADAGAQCRYGAGQLRAAQRLLQFLVFAQLLAVRAELPDRDRARIGAEKHLQETDVAQLRQFAAELGRQPRAERVAAGRGDAVQLAPSPAVLTRLGEIAGPGETFGLGVQLRVLQRPQVPDASGHHRLQVVRGSLTGLHEQAKHDVGSGRQPDIFQ